MLTPGTLYTPKSFTPEGFYTKCTSHQRVVTPEDLLHVGHNCALHQNNSTPGGFCLTPRSSYSTRNHFRQRAATPLEFYTKKFSTRRRYTAKRDLGLQNTKTLYIHRPAPPCSCATLDCKTHAEQRHSGLQNTSKRNRLRGTARPCIAITLFIPLPSSQCRDHLVKDLFIHVGLHSHLSFLWYLHSFRLLWKEPKSTAPVIHPFDVISTDVAAAQRALPSFGKTSQAQAGACKEDNHPLDIGLLSGIPQLF